MSITEKIFNHQVVHPVEAVNNILNKLYANDDEKLGRKALLYRLQQQPTIVQYEINNLERQHRSFFVAGWRPFVGWVCAWNLIYLMFLRDLLVWAMKIGWPDITPPPAIGENMALELVIALLGLGALRTVEKYSGRSR